MAEGYAYRWRTSCTICHDPLRGGQVGVCNACLEARRRSQHLTANPFVQYAAREHPGHPTMHVRLGLQLEQAHREGRLDPEVARRVGVPALAHGCAVCGMACATEKEAADCCTEMVEVPEDCRAKMLEKSAW